MAKKLGERLIEQGLVTKEAVEQALSQQKLTGHKLGDCLVELGLIEEAALLRFLAAEFGTRFVSTDKLSKVKVAPDVMDRVPVRMAEAQLFLPLAIDQERKILQIVAAEPQNTALLDEIGLVAGVDEVYAYVGLRSAISAAIRKHYYGDPTAFMAVEPGATGPHLRADLSAATSAYESGRTGSRSAPGLPLLFETDPRARATRTTIGTGISSAPGTRPPSQLRDVLSLVRGSIADADYTETLNIFVGLLESSRRHLRGHSGQLARQCTLIARRLGLPPKEVSCVAIAAYLHDLGKPSDRHLTLANALHDEGWKLEARNHYRAPVKLFETVRLPPMVMAILGNLYEAFDGSGLPNGSKGDDIPMGARIVAAVDSYLDLMKNPANAWRRALSRDEALLHMRAQSGKLYDPVVVDVVSRLHSGELLRQRVAADGRQVLIADPDESVRTDLVDALIKAGVVVQSLSTLDGAADAALSGDIDVVIIGLRFGTHDVIGLVEALRRQPASASVPVVVLGEAPDAMSRERLAQAGVSSSIALPLDPAQALKTIMGLYTERIQNGGPGRAVGGSFDEIAQTDLLRVLGKGRKNGRVSFRIDGREGFLHLERGRIVYASLDGTSGENAMDELLRIKHAEFTYDPESLLLDVPQLDADPSALAERLERASA